MGNQFIVDHLVVNPPTMQETPVHPGLGRSAGKGISYPLQYSWVSLVAQLVKNPPANAEEVGSVPGLGRSPGEGKGYPLQSFGLENSMNCIVPWGFKESDMTK